jgi:hypothetical protein
MIIEELAALEANKGGIDCVLSCCCCLLLLFVVVAVVVGIIIGLLFWSRRPVFQLELIRTVDYSSEFLFDKGLFMYLLTK